MAVSRVRFYSFNLNKGFLISCLRSCQSEKFLYYTRLDVPELSQLHNTQHHYPAAPYHSALPCGQGPGATRAAVPTQPASRQPPGSSVLVCQTLFDGRDIAQ